MDEKRVKGKKRGAILIITFMAIAVLVIISMGMFLRMLSESRAAERYRDATEAFYLAEAAIDTAVTKLHSNSAYSGESDVSFGDRGKYSLVVTSKPLPGGKTGWLAVGTGYIPPGTPPNARAQKRVEAFLQKKPAEDFPYDSAIVSSGDVLFQDPQVDVTGTDINGAPVPGKVRYGSGIDGEDRIDPLPDPIPDPNINPLPLLDFEELRQKAISQNNLFNKAAIDSGKAFPTDFYYDKSDPDSTKWMPNVVYIEWNSAIDGTFKLSGTQKDECKIAGFIIIGGDVVADVAISGKVTVNGCIYTSIGSFVAVGGGGPNTVNVNGGIWTGGTCTLKGNPRVNWNEEYMNAIKNNVEPKTKIQLISWREVKVE